jgi:hypothetical protein
VERFNDGWERLEDWRAFSINKCIETAGFSDCGKWPKLQDEMIDAMIRLKKALKKHIKTLNI